MASAKPVLPGRAVAPYSFFLVTLLLLLVVHPVMSDSTFGLLLYDFLFSIVLLAGLLSLGRQRRMLVFAVSLVAPAILLRWLAQLAGSEILLLLSLAFQAAFLAFAAAVVVMRVLDSREVTADTIIGGICGYVLLALLWASLYAFVELYTPGSFLDRPGVAGGAAEAEGFTEFWNLLYFSFVTLTTLGYGDISPVAPSVRTLAIIEAAIGVLYMAVVIARLVGLAQVDDSHEGSRG